jgi:hypothetical protein
VACVYQHFTFSGGVILCVVYALLTRWILGLSPRSVSMNSVTVNISVWMYVFISLRQIPRSGTAEL